MPTIVLTEEQLTHATLAEMQTLADQVGIGYSWLDEEGLRERLRFEGVTQ